MRKLISPIIFILLIGMSCKAEAQVTPFAEVFGGVNQTKLIATTASGKTGFQIGFGSSFKKASNKDAVGDKVSITSLTRYSRRSFLFSPDGTKINVSSIELGLGPRISFKNIDLSLKALYVIPVSNSAKDLTGSRLKEDDFDNSFAGLLGDVYAKFTPRIHAGVEYSIFASPYYRDGSGFSPVKRKLNWLGLNLRYMLAK